ncbi:DMT family transporter [Alphaproteobacteria bacterium]|jgi:drug/metabolite transporter (DMT)-like permease|nr:DMT family transporter [Alphaproteobacteria bacterium]MBT5799689.1 DMT family transporter [Alphaproteobacteria bacterium]MDA9190594.1 DMT family transporter [Alphaproteobacteria bacterium]MDA9816257.1 DMT family transporter [Alphaproteobacteria bacterium]
MTARNNPPLAILLFIGAVSFNAIKDGISKLLSSDITPITFLSIQYMFLVIILALPISIYFGKSALIPPRIGLQLLRGASACLGVGFYYWSVHYIHIADAIAVVFVSPLIVTVLSPWLLGEKSLGIRRITAVLVGFIGVLIIVQPSFIGETPGYLIALGAGFFISFFYLLNRKLAPESPLICSVFHSALCASFFLLPLLFFYASPIIPSQLPTLSSFAIFSAIGQIGMIAAFRLAPANIVSPFIYAQIIAATCVGYYLFGAIPNPITWLGILIIVGAGIYIALREIKLGKAT